MQDWYWDLAWNQWLGSLSFPKVKSTIILPKEHSIKLFSKTHRLMSLLDVPHQKSFLCSRHQLVQKFKIGPSTDTKWTFGHKWYICIIPAPHKAQGPSWKIVWKAVRTRGQRRPGTDSVFFTRQTQELTSAVAACSDQTSQHWSMDPNWLAANKWWLLSKGQSGMSPGRSTMTQWLSPQAYIGRTNWAQMLFLKMDINLGSTVRTMDHCPHNLQVLWGQWELNMYAYI